MNTALPKTILRSRSLTTLWSIKTRTFVVPSVNDSRQHWWWQSSRGRTLCSSYRFQKFHHRSFNSQIKMNIPKTAFKQGSTCPPLARDTLRLYSMRFCPFALRTRLALSHKNISHETVNINLLSKPDWFLSKNPKGLVPVLEYNDKIIYESIICNDYLDAVYPDVPLTSADPYIRARHQMMMDHYTPIARGFYRIAFAPSKEDKAKAMDKVITAMKLLEKHLENEFFGGHQPGMLDFYAYPHLALWDFIVTHHEKITDEEVMGGYQFPRDVLPKLGAWLDRMKKIPAVVTNTERTEDMVKFLQSWMRRTNIDYDAGLVSSQL